MNAIAGAGTPSVGTPPTSVYAQPALSGFPTSIWNMQSQEPGANKLLRACIQMRPNKYCITTVIAGASRRRKFFSVLIKGFCMVLPSRCSARAQRHRNALPFLSSPLRSLPFLPTPFLSLPLLIVQRLPIFGPLLLTYYSHSDRSSHQECYPRCGVLRGATPY